MATGSERVSQFDKEVEAIYELYRKTYLEVNDGGLLSLCVNALQSVVSLIKTVVEWIQVPAVIDALTAIYAFIFKLLQS